MNNEKKEHMTVQEAGEKGGSIGGNTTFKKYGRGFYHDIGTKGGQRVRELVNEGKEAEK